MNAPVPSVAAPSARARVQEVISPKGIHAWLVEDYTLPLMAMEFCFTSGTTNDPVGKSGVTYLLSRVIDEGAGEYDSTAFQEALANEAIELSFSAGYHWFQGSLRTLIAAKDEALRLTHLALTDARLDDEPVQRMKDERLSDIKQELTDPDSVASRVFMTTGFGDHVYGVPPRGTLESLPVITREDLVAARSRVLRRDQLMIAVVGAIDVDTLTQTLDRLFGDLPLSDTQPLPSKTSLQGMGAIEIEDLDVPNSTFSFGFPSISHDDPDFHAVMVINHILGEGSFTSRLWHEIRETRGLAYSIRTSLAKFRDCPLVMGSMSTANERAKEAYGVLKTEMQKMGEHGPTLEEVEAAKAYLIGSYGLKFDSSTKIASELIDIAYDGLGIDYLDQREHLIRAVTLEDAVRVAKRLCGDGSFLLAVAGRPVGLSHVSQK
jgi:zinc protease